MQFPQYSWPERIADGIVHVTGIADGIAASIVLTISAVVRPEPTYATGLGV